MSFFSIETTDYLAGFMVSKFANRVVPDNCGIFSRGNVHVNCDNEPTVEEIKLAISAVIQNDGDVPVDFYMGGIHKDHPSYHSDYEGDYDLQPMWRVVLNTAKGVLQVYRLMRINGVVVEFEQAA
jgi:hypothetical protein